MSDYIPPSIPPIQNIADKPTKSALMALVEGWQVRNGQTGSGANRFITKTEFDLALKNLGVPQAVAQQEVPGTYAVGGGGSSTSGCVDLLPLDNWWTGRNIWNQAFPASTDAPNWHIRLATAGLARWDFILGHPAGLPGATPNAIPIGSWTSPTDTSDFMFISNVPRSNPNYAGGIAMAFLPANYIYGQGIVVNGRIQCEGIKDQDALIIDSKTPTNTTTANSHIKLLRGGVEHWKFQLGHSASTPDTTGDMFLTNSGGISLTLKSMAHGGALSFLDRTSGNQLGKTAIQLRDTMSIGWNVSDLAGVVPGGIKTYFKDDYWRISNGDLSRFAVDVRMGVVDCIKIGNSRNVSDYLSDNMTVNAVYTSTGVLPNFASSAWVSGVTWMNGLGNTSRATLQTIISDLASGSVDNQLSINAIRNLADTDGITTKIFSNIPANYATNCNLWKALNITYGTHVNLYGVKAVGDRVTIQQAYDDIVHNLYYAPNSHAKLIDNIRGLTGYGFTESPKNALMLKLDSLSSGGTVTARITSPQIPINWGGTTNYKVEDLIDNLAYQSKDWRANFVDIRNLSGLYNPNAPTTNFAIKLAQISSIQTAVNSLNYVYVSGTWRTQEGAFTTLETSLGNLWNIVNGMTKP